MDVAALQAELDGHLAAHNASNDDRWDAERVRCQREHQDAVLAILDQLVEAGSRLRERTLGA